MRDPLKSSGSRIHSTFSYTWFLSSAGRSKKRKGCRGAKGEGALEASRDGAAEDAALVVTEEAVFRCLGVFLVMARLMVIDDVCVAAVRSLFLGKYPMLKAGHGTRVTWPRFMQPSW